MNEQHCASPGVIVNAALALVPLATACSTRLADRPMSLMAVGKGEARKMLGGGRKGKGEGWIVEGVRGKG